jgi:cytochrome c oxidase cbb3-type subunit 3
MIKWVKYVISAMLALRICAGFASAQEPAVERGQKQFSQSCAFCHGADATGGRGPDLIRSELVNDDTSGVQTAQFIKSGRPEKGMPAFATLSDGQINDIIAFLHDRIKNQSVEPGGDYPLARLLVGNADAGRAFFAGAGGCSSCHSPTGDLKGIATRLKPLDLQQRMLMPETGPPTATVHPKGGSTVEGRLAALDEFRIALRDAQGWYRSFDRNQVTFEIKDRRAAHHALLPKWTDTEIHDAFAYLETLK